MNIRNNVRRIIQWVAIVVCLFLSMSPAFAAVTATPTGNPDGSVSITGTSNYKDAPVGLQVKEGNDIRYFDQGMTDGNGAYQFSFQVDQDKSYTGKVNIEGETKTFPISTKAQGGNGTTPGGSGTTTAKSKTFYLRIEGYNRTLLPRTAITADNFDLTPYLGSASGSSATPSAGWGPDKLPNVTALHGIVRGLEQIGINPKDHQSGADIQDYGWSLYVAMIGGEREFDHRSTSGWMYRVNDTLPSVGSQAYSLENGDDMVWYFSAYGYDNAYSKIEANKTSVNPKEEVEITLTEPSKGPIKNAILYVNGQEAKVGGQKVTTNEQGKAKLTFDRPGSYAVSAERFKQDIRDLVRPHPVTIQVTGEAAPSVPVAQLKKTFEDVLAANKEDELVAVIKQAVDQTADAKRETSTQLKDVSKDLQLITGWIEKAEAKVSKPASFTTLAECRLRLLEVAGELTTASLDGEDKKILEETITALFAGYGSTLAKAEQTAVNAEGLLRLVTAVDKLYGKLDEKKVQQTVGQVFTKLTQLAIKKEQMKNDGSKSTVTLDDTIMKDIQRIQQQQKVVQKGLETSKFKLANLAKQPITIVIPSEKSNKVRIQLKDDVLVKLPDTIQIRTDALQVTFMPKAFTGQIGKGETLVLHLDTVAVADYPKELVSATDKVRAMLAIDTTSVGKTVLPTEPLTVSIPYEQKANTKLPDVYTSVKNQRVTVPAVYNAEEKMLVVTLVQPGTVLLLDNDGATSSVGTQTYKDLTGFEWAQEAIYALQQKGIISGTSKTTFAPGRSITRAEFAALLARAYKPATAEGTAPSFRDVGESKWYTESIQHVYRMGVMKGVSEDRFGPEQAMSREEAAVVITRLLKQHKELAIETVAPLSFKDQQSISAWAKQDIALAAQQGIVSGMTDQTFAPKKPVTRAEAAVMLHRLEQKLNP
ncbi:S-layer homology domain-containing protein [Aneurinibacillus sp. BA2021]|nr:S-layer homology domain-containing protein [Aneurinibacillus sp. BA2021]